MICEKCFDIQTKDNSFIKENNMKNIILKVYGKCDICETTDICYCNNYNEYKR